MPKTLPSQLIAWLVADLRNQSRIRAQFNIEFEEEIFLGEVGVNPTLSRNREKFISSRITQIILNYPTVEDCGAEILI